MKEKLEDLISSLDAMIADNEKKADDYAAGCVSTAILVKTLLQNIIKTNDTGHA